MHTVDKLPVYCGRICAFLQDQKLNVMKTNFTKIGVLLLLGASLTFQACKKDEESKNTALNTMGTAVITGKLSADLILNNGQKEGVAGISVTGTVNTQDLVTNPVAGTTYARKTYVATTDNDGIYKLVVDANVKSVTVTFDIPQSFSADQTIENGTKQRTVFTRTGIVPATVVVNKGQTVTQDAEYTYDVETAVGLAKFTGMVYLRSDLCKADPDSQLTAATAGTIIVATWMDDDGRNREVEVSTGANGKFEFSVETKNASKSISLKGRKFIGARKALDGTDCKTKTDYEFTNFSNSESASRNETTKIADIIFE